MQIVITSINEPSEGVKRFAAQHPGRVIVVGDAKTPTSWECPGVRFLSFEDEVPGSAYAGVAPVNHYARKNLGYLIAAHDKSGIAETDDDNLPYEWWSFPPQEGSFLRYSGEEAGLVNCYSWFTSQEIWPRGLPLQRIRDSFRDIGPATVSRAPARVAYWQALADREPDVDAVYRLTSNLECVFDPVEEIVFAGPAVAPTNSQNTFWFADAYPLMYLPMSVSFRFTDILRGYIASVIANSLGLVVGVARASVWQERNEHSYIADFASEVDMYLNCERVLKIVTEATRTTETASGKMLQAYEALAEERIVSEVEVDALKLWLSDLAAAGPEGG